MPTINLNELKAFPTAEGFGKNTVGGRGKAVGYVINLNDSGTGSLRAAMEDPNIGYVLFKVSGTIILSSHIQPSTHKTLAVQTACIDGGIGITLRNNGLWTGPMITRSSFVDNAPPLYGLSDGQLIFRFLRSRRGVGTNGESSGDNITLAALRYVVLDHCDVSFSTDENIDFSYSDLVTIQESIVAEGLMWASHEYTWNSSSNQYRNGHSKGMIADRVRRFSSFRNMLISNDERNWYHTVANGGTDLEFTNNIIYNPMNSGHGFYRFIGLPYQTLERARANYIGNRFMNGPQTNTARFMFQVENYPSNTFIYMTDNIDPNFRAVNTGNEWVVGEYLAGSNNGTTLLSENNRTFTEHDFPLKGSPRVLPLASLKTSLLATVGNFLASDSHRTRQLGYVQNESGGSIINGDGLSDQGFPQFTAFTGGYSTASGTVTTVDTSGNGMPDSFQTAHGVTDAAGVKTNWTFGELDVVNTAGYNNLEMYLAWIAKDFERLSGVTTPPLPTLITSKSQIFNFI